MRKILLLMLFLGLLGLFNKCESEKPDINKIKNDLVNKDLGTVSKTVKLGSSQINKITILDQAETDDLVTYDVEINTNYNTLTSGIKPLYLRVFLAYEKINNQWQFLQHKIIALNIQ